MKNVAKSIKTVLGKDAEPFEYHTGGSDRKGWRTYVRQGKPKGRDKALELVEASSRALHEEDVRLFVGPILFRIGPNEYARSVECDPDDFPPGDLSKIPPSYSQVLALPGLAVPDIAEFCETGSHDCGEWEPVQKGLRKIEKIAPFAVQYANDASLGATFLSPVTPAQATKIGKIILMEVNVEAGDLLPYELEKLGHPVPMEKDYPDCPDVEAAMTAYLVAAGKFKLWWD